MAKKKGYLNLLNCHLAISMNRASYYASSERGNSGTYPTCADFETQCVRHPGRAQDRTGQSDGQAGRQAGREGKAPSLFRLCVRMARSSDGDEALQDGPAGFDPRIKLKVLNFWWNITITALSYKDLKILINSTNYTRHKYPIVVQGQCCYFSQFTLLGPLAGWRTGRLWERALESYIQCLGGPVRSIRLIIGLT